MATANDHRPHILCVDDEPNVVDAIRRQYRKQYQVSTASSGAEALELLKSESEKPFGVIISDFNMPGMDGIEFLGAARQYRPDSSMVMLTGRAELDIAVKALHEGRIFRFLNKPCLSEVLEQAIEDGFKQFELIKSERDLKVQLEYANAQLAGLNTQLEQKVEQRTKTIRSMNEFITGLNGLTSVAEISEYAAHATAELLHSEQVAIFLPDKNCQSLHVRASIGVGEEAALQKLLTGTGITAQVFASKRAQVLRSDEEVTLQYQDGDDFFQQNALICVPMVSSGTTVGVLNITGHLGNEAYSDEDIQGARSIAESTATAISSQNHMAQRDEAQEAIILALATLSEYRDPETGGHLKRLQHYCDYMARYLQTDSPYASEITDEFVYDLGRSSPLHDIGKVGIPDSILCKPGRLTDEEFEIMKTHAAIGGDTLKQIVLDGHNHSFLKMGMQIAYCHHEKWDGSGYPKGIAGKQIPLSARILALADVYDALTSQRVYKPAFRHEKAMGIITEGIGTHFDPLIVEAFLACREEFQETAIRLKDQVPATRLLE
ncbi:MAG: response regulator [Pseudomonadales bacterium]|nr:response regulator [Pseudomonadales bacterium]